MMKTPMDDNEKPDQYQEDEVLTDDAASALQDRISELEEKNAEFKDRYLRAHAEMENLRKRTSLEIQKREKYAISGFARDILSVADSLERALASVPEDNQDELLAGFVSGMKITLDELQSIFAKYKIVRIGAVGEKFDPDRHQAIQAVEDVSVEDGTIVSEWQSGYMIDDRVLRDAKVVVAKNKH